MDLIGRRKVGRQVLESASTGLLGVTDKRLRHPVRDSVRRHTHPRLPSGLIPDADNGEPWLVTLNGNFDLSYVLAHCGK
jgi:hypothetical protein